MKIRTRTGTRELVCLHSLGFKDSTKNTHTFLCFPKFMGEKKLFITRFCASLSLSQKEENRLCDVNDDAFKEEEDEDKEEEDTSKSASSIFR